MTVTAHAIQLPYDANSDYASSKAIYKADKNLFASHSNYESELLHSPSLDNLETEKASVRISAPWLTPRHSHLGVSRSRVGNGSRVSQTVLRIYPVAE